MTTRLPDAQTLLDGLCWTWTVTRRMDSGVDSKIVRSGDCPQAAEAMIHDATNKPMFLPGVENNPDSKGAYAELIQMVRTAGGPVSQIWHLFAFKPDATRHLERFTQAIMRGPGPISPGMRELIAAYTSVRNHCPF